MITESLTLSLAIFPSFFFLDTNLLYFEIFAFVFCNFLVNFCFSVVVVFQEREALYLFAVYAFHE